MSLEAGKAVAGGLIGGFMGVGSASKYKVAEKYNQKAEASPLPEIDYEEPSEDATDWIEAAAMSSVASAYSPEMIISGPAYLGAKRHTRAALEEPDNYLSEMRENILSVANR